jgi:integrase
LTVLKAALNHAFQEGRVSADEPWRKVKPFREVDSAMIRYLSADECRRLVNACSADFQALVRGPLATGCRYGELTRMTNSDFNFEARTVTVRRSKAGKVRHVTQARGRSDDAQAGHATVYQLLTRLDPFDLHCVEGVPHASASSASKLGSPSNGAPTGLKRRGARWDIVTPPYL